MRISDSDSSLSSDSDSDSDSDNGMSMFESDSEQVVSDEQRCRGWLQMVGRGHSAEHATMHEMLRIEYGSSLKLQADVTALLSQHFDKLDMNRDWAHHRRHQRDLMFFAIVDTRTQAREPVCAVRIVVDNVSSAARARTVIDHVYTPPAHRGRGYATLLVEFVQNWSVILENDVYVSALTVSTPYWMARGFRLEENAVIVERLNEYSNTVLMKMPGNRS